MIAAGLDEILLVLWMCLALNPAGTRLSDQVDVRAYWESRGVPWEEASLLKELQDDPGADEATLRAALDRLGASTHADREAAADVLRAAGPAALPHLQQAAASEDPEIRLRARELLLPLRQSQSASAGRRLLAIRALGGLSELTEAGRARLQSLAESAASADETSLARQALGAPLPVPAPLSAQRATNLLAHLPGRLDAAGFRGHFQRQHPLSLAARFGRKGLWEEIGRLRELTPRIQQTTVKWLERAGELELEGLAVGLAENPRGRRLGIALALRGDTGRLREALRAQAEARVERDGRTWYRLRAGVQACAADGGFLLFDLSAAFDPAWWRPCPLPAEAEGAPTCWPASLRDTAEAAFRQATPAWLAWASVGDPPWRTIPALAPVREWRATGHPVGEDFAWRFELRAQCEPPGALAPLLTRASGGLEDARKAARSAAVNLTALRPLSGLLEALQLDAEGDVLRLRAEVADPDEAALALPFLRLLLRGGGF
jgi:hypothetical protein